MKISNIKLKLKLDKKQKLIIAGATLLVIIIAFLTAGFLIKQDVESRAVESMESAKQVSMIELKKFNESMTGSDDKSVDVESRDAALIDYSNKVNQIQSTICKDYLDVWYLTIMRATDWSGIYDKCKKANESYNKVVAAKDSLVEVYSDDKVLSDALSAETAVDLKIADDYIKWWTAVGEKLDKTLVSDEGAERKKSLVEAVNAHISDWTKLKTADGEEDREAYETALESLNESLASIGQATEGQDVRLKDAKKAFSLAHAAFVD